LSFLSAITVKDFAKIFSLHLLMKEDFLVQLFDEEVQNLNFFYQLVSKDNQLIQQIDETLMMITCHDN
jgi:hypothetical protein